VAKVAFLVPIRPGKRGAYIEFAKSLSGDQLASLYREFGIRSHLAFVADNFIVSYYEASDPAQVRKMWALPAVQEVVRTQMASLVDFDPLALDFLDVAFEWNDVPLERS
jgi:hypothetical protein